MFVLFSTEITQESDTVVGIGNGIGNGHASLSLELGNCCGTLPLSLHDKIERYTP